MAMVSAPVAPSNSDPIIRGRSSTPRRGATTAPLGGKGSVGRVRGDDAARKSARPPLLSADPDNVAPTPAPRPKAGKVVSSRYLSSSSSTTTSGSSSSASSSIGVSPVRRCLLPSPALARTGLGNAATPLIKRSQSAERRRPGTPGTPCHGTPVGIDSGGRKTTGTQRMLASARSLSVSFRGELYSVPVDKVKTAAEKPTSVVTARPMCGGGIRRGTPERSQNATAAIRQTSADSLKAAMEQKHRWPGRTAMSMSVDFGNSTILNRSVVRGFRNSMTAAEVKGPDGRTDKPDTRNDLQFKKEAGRYDNGSLEIVHNRISASEFVGSDGEIVSSGSISSVKESAGNVPVVMNGIGDAIPGVRGIEVPARYWPEETTRLARPVSPMAALSKFPSTPKKLSTKGPGSDSPVSSPKGYLSSQRQASPLRGAGRPATPSKFSSLSVPSPTRGLSPSRVRNSSEGSVVSSTPSMLSFAAEARRGRMGESWILDAHALRLLHNRLLQWRFVNAWAYDALFAQRLNAERSLYNSWVRISKLREAVKAKALQLQLLKHILKLSSVLNGQMVHLEKWVSMDRDYSDSLLGATESLHASTLRLPVIGGARVNVQKLKVAFYSALEVLQAMATSICISSSKVDEVHNFVAELADVTLRGRALLDHCTDLLSTNTAMQINEFSLRAHISQQNEVPPVG
ncbi:hypothetical protein MLD38_012967 [Melastoma candidum]|uniref:Uncharacterized protein n=1 Tax=Melastoma candidum TaxID=119954 RepID=A0ACB9R969_9MYRT|nr:hypothetical protein MLD38_012967 [Melastoma candidum]